MQVSACLELRLSCGPPAQARSQIATLCTRCHLRSCIGWVVLKQAPTQEPVTRAHMWPHAVLPVHASATALQVVYTYADALRWSIQMAEGLVYLHTRHPLIIHRDLKLDNVLLSGASPQTALVLPLTCTKSHISMSNMPA